MGQILRFKDGQMIDSERITGLIKFERYADGAFMVLILGVDGNVEFECETKPEQEELLSNLSAQLALHLNPVELVDLNLASSVKTKGKMN